jgi:CRP-like cAMP-binding protein
MSHSKLGEMGTQFKENNGHTSRKYHDVPDHIRDQVGPIPDATVHSNRIQWMRLYVHHDQSHSMNATDPLIHWQCLPILAMKPDHRNPADLTHLMEMVKPLKYFDHLPPKVKPSRARARALLATPRSLPRRRRTPLTARPCAPSPRPTRGAAQVELQLVKAMTYLAVDSLTKVVTQGDPADAFYIIMQGRAYPEIEMNGVAMHLPALNAGACFGEAGLLEDKPRPASITMVGESELLVVDKQWYVDIINNLENEDAADSFENKVVSFCKQVPVLHGLPEDRLMQLAEICTLQRYSQNEVIFTQGKARTTMAIITDGEARVLKEVPNTELFCMHFSDSSAGPGGGGGGGGGKSTVRSEGEGAKAPSKGSPRRIPMSKLKAAVKLGSPTSKRLSGIATSGPASEPPPRGGYGPGAGAAGTTFIELQRVRNRTLFGDEGLLFDGYESANFGLHEVSLVSNVFTEILLIDLNALRPQVGVCVRVCASVCVCCVCGWLVSGKRGCSDMQRGVWCIQWCVVVGMLWSVYPPLPLPPLPSPPHLGLLLPLRCRCGGVLDILPPGVGTAVAARVAGYPANASRVHHHQGHSLRKQLQRRRPLRPGQEPPCRRLQQRGRSGRGQQHHRQKRHLAAPRYIAD